MATATRAGPIDVVVAEDSTVTRLRLVRLLEGDPRIRVVAAVADGQAALDFVLRHKPDLVLMDLHMPRLDGFEATRRIMEAQPVPIVVCSAASNVGDAAVAFRALEAGALACVAKPFGGPGEDSAATVGHLLDTIRLMAEVKVVRRRPRPRPSRSTPAAAGPAAARAPLRIVGIGASTGGPPVLQALLAALPPDFPLPLLVVQHIARGFLPGLVAWLAESSGPRVEIAAAGVLPLPGHAYLAPDDFHLGLAGDGRIALSRRPPENHVRPAVSFLFRSLADTVGAQAVGVLLTGMGRDGAQELKALRGTGAITIAQDLDSSVVHGMPGLAIALGGASHVLPAERIGPLLATLAPPSPG
jgi:two-component system chemotaxis response regulator CheB